jgi:hypothetical protein
MTVTVRAVNTIHEYVAEVMAASELLRGLHGDEDVWFRGVGDNSLGLVPGAYWRNPCDEFSLLLSFEAMVPSFVGRQPADRWEWYYLAQHYGLPTRLLDWTESALAAVYFALSTAQEGKTPCVWVMLPGCLNRLTHLQDRTLIFVPGGRPDIDAWLPPKCGRGKPIVDIDSSDDLKSNQYPIAIFPRRYNPRIVAQRGTFTVHGTEETGIDQLLVEMANGEPVPMLRLDLRVADPAQGLRDLRALGVDKPSLFPEPQSIAEDLKSSYGVGP